MTQRILFIEYLELFFFCSPTFLHCRRIFKSQFSASKQASHIQQKFLDTKWPGCLEILQFQFDFLLLVVNNMDGLHKNCGYYSVLHK